MANAIEGNPAEMQDNFSNSWQHLEQSVELYAATSHSGRVHGAWWRRWRLSIRGYFLYPILTELSRFVTVWSAD
jgi:hypothetical protein